LTILEEGVNPSILLVHWKGSKAANIKTTRNITDKKITCPEKVFFIL